jgi:diaminopimelate decarboxylase
MQNPDVIRYPADAIQKAIAEFPTPFLIYEEEQIRKRCREFKDAFGPLFPNFRKLYALKANPNPHIVKIIKDEGFGADCSSLSELWLANALGMSGMHTGNYTTEEELKAILASKDMLLNLDDASMLETVKKLGTPEFLSFRINPGTASSTMESTLLAGPNAKYGIPWEKATDAYRKAKDMGVQRFGIHMMTGSNVADEEYFGIVTRKLLEIAGSAHKELGIDFEFMNIGGGFNVPYHPDEPTFDLKKIAQNVRTAFDEECPKYDLPEPTLMVEPGRRITADAGFLVGTVTVIKESYKNFVGLNASTNAVPRIAFYDVYHHISVLGKDSANGTKTVNVVGSICENNDQFGQNRELPKVAVGDTLVIHNCGGHASALGHNYNGKVRPAEYLLRTDGTIEQIRREETIEDLFATVTSWS